MIVCKLKEVLKRKGWTRYRLQKESGVTFPTIYMMYGSRSKLYSAAVLNKLCRALECQPGDLLHFQIQRYPRREDRRKSSIR
jgi:putative transcriptional regulator